MADRKATNKYIPPDFDPEKHGTINQYIGQHPLRERARKLHLGILVVRFELPFHIWCGSCGRHLAKGVRFNAEKKLAGSYFSTKIWSFRMKCPSCSGLIEMQTDPKNHQYIVTEGGKKKTEDWEATPEDMAMKFTSEEEKEKIDTDPIYRLQHLAKDKEKFDVESGRLEKLMEYSDATRKDYYGMNAALRAKTRERKHDRDRRIAEATKLGIGGELVEGDGHTRTLKTHIQIGLKKSKHEKHAKLKEASRGEVFREKKRDRSWRRVQKMKAVARPDKIELLKEDCGSEKDEHGKKQIARSSPLRVLKRKKCDEKEVEEPLLPALALCGEYSSASESSNEE